MNQGHVIQWGTPWDVYYAPRTAFMAEFLGSVNLISAPIIGSASGAVRVNLAGQALEISAEESPPAGDQVLLSIRPETLTIRRTLESHGAATIAESLARHGEGVDGDSAAGGYIALAGEVVNRTFLGHVMRYTVRIGQHDWLVDQPDPGSAELADGAVVVQVNPRRVHIIPEPNA
jgi:spermidine/putrescine transport system ATP-binding protein